jgi:hypothetical protein
VIGPKIRQYADRTPVARRVTDLNEYRLYRGQVDPRDGADLYDDVVGDQWVAHAIAAHNRRERNRRVAKEVAIIFGVLACALGAFLMWGIG